MRGPSLSQVAQALNDEPERWAPVIIGEAPNKAMSNSRELRFYKKGGMVVKLQGPKRGNWSHHGHDRFGDMLDLIMYIQGVTRKEAHQIGMDMLGVSDGAAIKLKPRKSDAEVAADEREENERRIRAARFIWSKSSTRLAPQAIGYLEARAITKLTSGKCPAVRHRKLDRYSLEKMEIEHEGEAARFPDGLHALVFGATTPDGRIAAVQQIILDGTRKAEVENKKRSNGVMDGAAVRLGGTPTTHLDVAEGPETGLSCWEATDLPTWIALGASNLTRIPVPDHVTTMRFAVEIEPTRTGIRSGLRAANHWMRQGKTCLLAMPRVPSDMNDVHREIGLGAVREDLDAALAPDRNPFRDGSGRLLSEDAQNDLPVVVTWRADESLAAWLSTGLGCLPLLKPHEERDGPENGKAAEALAYLLPEGIRKVLIVLNAGERLPRLDGMPDDVMIRVLHLTTTLEELRRRGGGDAVRRVMKLHAEPGKAQPIGVENLALRPDGLVVMTTGRGAAKAAAGLFPGSAVLGVSTSIDSREIDWSLLAGRQVLVAPANRQEEILAAEQIASDAVDAGATDVRIVKWPSIVPMQGGWRARGSLPDGYDLRWLAAEGWSPEDAEILVRLGAKVTQSVKSAA